MPSMPTYSNEHPDAFAIFLRVDPCIEKYTLSQFPFIAQFDEKIKRKRVVDECTGRHESVHSLDGILAHSGETENTRIFQTEFILRTKESSSDLTSDMVLPRTDLLVVRKINKEVRENESRARARDRDDLPHAPPRNSTLPRSRTATRRNPSRLPNRLPAAQT